MAHSVAAVSDVSSLPGPDILKDFDAIRASESNPSPGRAIARGAAMSLPGRNMFPGGRAARRQPPAVGLAAGPGCHQPPGFGASQLDPRAPARVRPPAPPAPLPPLPPSRSPISFFRELLAMNAAERKQALTNRSPESQNADSGQGARI